MKRYQLICFVIVTMLFGHIANGQEKKSIQWSPNWNVDDKHFVEMVQEKTQFGGDEKNVVVDKTVIEISIEEKTKDGYVVNWVYGPTTITAPKERDAMHAALADLKNGIPLKVKVDHDGIPKKLLNVDEVIKNRLKAVEALQEAGREAGLPKSTVEEIIDNSKKQYDDPKMVELSELHDIMLFFLFCKANMEFDKEIEIDGQMPKTGDFPYKCTAVLKKYDEKSHEAQIQLRQSIDETQNLPLDITDTLVYRIDTKKVWPVSIEFLKEISVQKKSQGSFGIKYRTLDSKYPK